MPARIRASIRTSKPVSLRRFATVWTVTVRRVRKPRAPELFAVESCQWSDCWMPEEKWKLYDLRLQVTFCELHCEELGRSLHVGRSSYACSYETLFWNFLCLKGVLRASSQNFISELTGKRHISRVCRSFLLIIRNHRFSDLRDLWVIRCDRNEENEFHN